MVFEGNAGPYALRVIIRTPSVIPARAEVIVRTLGRRVTRVSASAGLAETGEAGAPPPEAAVPTPGDSTLWSLQLWLMVQGSYAVRVAAEGPAGGGVLLVPITAVARDVLKMDRATGLLLAVLALFLISGMLTIVGAAAGDALAEPGVALDGGAVRRVQLARLAAGFVLALGIGAYGVWWRKVDRDHVRSTFRPTRMQLAIRADGPRSLLRVSFSPEEPRSISQPRRLATPLLPDHGKLLHLFAIRSDLAAMAHLHPIPLDSVTFETTLPPLPAGRYLFYGDIVHESGFAETMVAQADLSAMAAAWTPRDPDDAVAVSEPDGGGALPDGATLIWNGTDQGIIAGTDAPMTFTLRDAHGAVIPVEPYLGMAAHAVAVRAGGDVYVHLHPVGTTPMAAVRALA
ncbi:MAG: hypothetical protein ABI603_15955, partial [Acidobacteriota bacterium]